MALEQRPKEPEGREVPETTIKTEAGARLGSPAVSGERRHGPRQQRGTAPPDPLVPILRELALGAEALQGYRDEGEGAGVEGTRLRSTRA